MALRIWASSAANALRLSSTHLSPAAPPPFSLSRCFSTVLDGAKYATSHEWVKHEGSVATIGITDHAQTFVVMGSPAPELGDNAIKCVKIQDHLGEVVFVELPEVGGSVTKGSGFGAVESVKATSDINSPISGEVVEVNTKLTEAPGAINLSPYEGGWMIKVKPSDPSELESLMGPAEYTKFCEEEDAAH